MPINNQPQQGRNAAIGRWNVPLDVAGFRNCTIVPPVQEPPAYYYEGNVPATPAYRNANLFAETQEGRMLFADEDTGDEETVFNWQPDNISKKKKEAIKEITISDDCKASIKNIVNDLLADYLNNIRTIYESRIEHIGTLNTHNIMDAFSTDRDRIEYHDFVRIVTSFNALTNGETISINEDSLFLNKVENKAKELYHIDYSKYKFYPRLKSKVKYGNPELLAEILNVTQIVKGKVLWK